jgi:hypothetical protein
MANRKPVKSDLGSNPKATVWAVWNEASYERLDLMYE